MVNKNNNNELEKYAEDISTIKSLLVRVEEKSLVEHWAFYSWGFLIMAGTAIHLLLSETANYSIDDSLFAVWIPVMILGSIFETIAWIRKIRKESLPIFSKLDIKLWLTLMGNCTGTFFMVYILIKSGGIEYLPVFIILLFGLYILIYGLISYYHLYAYGYFLIFSAIIIYFMDLNMNNRFLVTGLILSSTIIFAGISTRKKEKEQND